MKNNRLYIAALTWFVAAISFTSCDNIYDEPDQVEIVATSENAYRLVNATSYAHWVYFNLHQRDSITLHYSDKDVPIAWDMAIHRYDVKTNGGSVLETNYTSLETLKEDIEAGVFVRPMPATYTPDEPDSIITDLSRMMEGIVQYEKTDKNIEMGKWLNVNLRDMPPIYTPSNKVYLLRMKDNTVAAVHFTGFTNPNKYNIKGYISFEYLYPLNFRR